MEHDDGLLQQRYSRQIRFASIGLAGQRRLSTSRVLLCGCGALGSVLANTLVRAGCGFLRLVDRDFVELSNLQRQVLYDEADAEAGLPKAIAAATRLRRINSSVEIEPVVADVDHRNIASLCDGVDLILDGLDNFETRYLINDTAHRLSLPWVFGGCLGAEGQTMTIIPGQTACLRCLTPDPPPPGSTATCDSAGVLGPIINVIASMQACEAMKILSGNSEAINNQLTVIDLWTNRMRQVGLDALKSAGHCDACAGRDFPWLDGRRASHSAILCGRNAVQLNPPDRSDVDLQAMRRQLEGLGEVTANDFLLRFRCEDTRITLFPDGRAIVQGTEDIAEAKSLYARYVGA